MPRAPKRVRLQDLLGESSTPVFLVSPDRRIVFFNAGCEKLTGWNRDEVVGQVCEYASSLAQGKVESLAASLCPPGEAFEGRIASAPALLPVRSGEPAARILNFVPILDDEGRVASILGIAAEAEPELKIAPTQPAAELHADLAALRLVLSRRFATRALVCHSDSMLRVAEQVAIARGTSAAVLISGESGTGKEHLARTIHSESEWRTRSFVPLDCRRLSALELEQTLRRLFERPREEDFFPPEMSLRPGTLFLANAERLPRDLQQMIVETMRGESGQDPGLRLIASTTLELAELSADSILRQDFFHLISPLTISVPPLRCRGDDLRYLAQALLEELNRGEARQLYGFADDVWEQFAQYHWPGNVEELFRVIQEARAECNEPRIRAKHLPFRFRTALDAQTIGPVREPEVQPLQPYLAQAEKERIEAALTQCRHNKSKAAQLLGMTRPRLYRRMEQLGIRDEEPGVAQG